MSRQMWVVGVVTLLVGSFLAVVAPPPVAADPTPVDGYEYVTAYSSFNSAATKHATVRCSEGKVPLGGGGIVNGLNSPVFISVSVPSSPDPGWFVRAQESVTGYGGNWSILAYAICASPPANYGTYPQSVSTDTENVQLVEQSCPSGQLVGAGGWAFSTMEGAVRLTALAPADDLGNVVAVGTRVVAGPTLYVGVTAICADLPTELHFQDGEVSSLAQKNTQSRCAVDSTVLGGGFSIGAATYAAYFRLGIRALAMPWTTGDPPWTGSIAFEDHIGTGDDWSLRSYAICVPN